MASLLSFFLCPPVFLLPFRSTVLSPLLINVNGIEKNVFSGLAEARKTKIQRFLAWPAGELAKKTELSIDKIKEISSIENARFGPKSATALQEERNFHRQCTGSPSAFKSLTRAKEGEIIGLVGPPGCGKTQHALTLVASVAASGRSEVVIDTSAGIFTDRIVQILASFGLSLSDIGSVMHCVLIAPAGTVVPCEQVLAPLIDNRLTVPVMSAKTSENMSPP